MSVRDAVEEQSQPRTFAYSASKCQNRWTPRYFVESKFTVSPFFPADSFLCHWYSL